jgi:hypothetical protein
MYVIQVRVGVTVTFSGVNLAYAEGVLHSTDDKPALVLDSRSDKQIITTHLEICSMLSVADSAFSAFSMPIAWWKKRARGY